MSFIEIISTTPLKNYIDNYLYIIGIVFKNLDPSNFTNIILGILAIFIPFAIVFLTDVINSSRKKSEFEKMVINDEVLRVKKIFWITTLSIVFFSFFSGTNIPLQAKLLAVIYMISVVYTLWKPFFSILKFSEGYKNEFEIKFLSKLTFKDQIKSEKLLRVWSSFWGDKDKIVSEDMYLKIFLDQVDHAMQKTNFYLSKNLIEVYLGDLSTRNKFLVLDMYFPLSLEWNKLLWSNFWNNLKKRNEEKSNSSKSFSILNWYKIKQDKNEYFWDNDFFINNSLNSMFEISLENDGHVFKFFDVLKKHIDQNKTLINTVNNRFYIEKILNKFCNIIFEKINLYKSKYDFLEENLPEEWKISTINKGNMVSQILFLEFIKWAPNKVFKKDSKEYNDDLSLLIKGIFPNVHPSLFPRFIILFFSSSAKQAVINEESFYVIPSGISFFSQNNENNEIEEMFNVKDREEKEETIGIILNYFAGYWDKLRLYKEDLSQEEQKNFESYSLIQKQDIHNKVKLRKLKKLKDDFLSKELVDYCTESKEKEYDRQTYIEILSLLINKLTPPTQKNDEQNNSSD